MTRRAKVLAVLLAVTAAKLWLAAVLGSTVNVNEIRGQAEAFLRGTDVLDPLNTGRTPSFLPAGNYLVAAACLLLSQATDLSFTFTLKAGSVIADLGIAAVLLYTPAGGPIPALLYMLNPVSFILSTYHGQLHTIAVFALVLACHFADGGRNVLSAIALAGAASIRQHFAVLLSPLVVVPGRKRVAALLTFTVSVLVLNGFLLAASAHPARVLAPAWEHGAWGYALLVHQAAHRLPGTAADAFAPAFTWIDDQLHRRGITLFWAWSAAFAAWMYRAPPPDLWRAALLFVMGIYALSPGIAVQWLLWAVPFQVVADRRHAPWFALLAGSFLLGSYWHWSLKEKYGVAAITLAAISSRDRGGVRLLTLLGLATWAFCVWSFVRLTRAHRGEAERGRRL